MSERGKPSIAHEFNKSGMCVHCELYEVNVNKMSLNCTPAREKLMDSQIKAKLAEKKAG